MEFDSLVRKRKSVRKFKKKRVSFRDVIDAIDAANQGPFPRNHNHLRYLIVESKEKIAKIAEVCEQDWIADSMTVVLVCSDDEHFENHYGPRGRVYSRQSAGAAIYAFMLKLAEVGIGSCWVGAYTDANLRKIFDIPSEHQIEAVVPIGFSADSAKKEKKKSLERSLFWENWGQTRKPTAFEEGDRDLGAE